MDAVRLNKAELIEKFGLSNLMAIRVGALLSQRVGVTEAVLEMVAQGGAVEKMLRHPMVLKLAGQLDTEALQTVASEIGAADEGAFVVVESDGWRTIAIEEEVLAEEGWSAGDVVETVVAVPPQALVPTSGRPSSLSQNVLDANELSAAFSPDDIAQLKLSALTSTDSGVKIESMRRLMFAPISDEEKGTILLKILIDPISNVRAEAVNCLRTLGFDSSLAEAVTALVESDEAGKVFGADRIGRQLDGASEQETFIVVELLVEQLREAPSARVVESLVRALSSAGSFLSQSEVHLKQLVDACVLRLASGERGLAGPGRSALLEIGRHDPNGVASLLWQEVQTTEAHDVRVFLMTTICQLDVKGELANLIAEAVAQEMIEPGVDEDSRLRLRYGAARLGSVCLGPLLSRLAAVTPEWQCTIIGVLDGIATERPVSKADKTLVARRLLDLLKVADRQVTIRILQTRICADEGVEDGTQAELAREFLANLREFLLPDVQQRITATLVRTGARAVQPILDFVEDAPNEAESMVAMRVLGDIVEEHGRRLELESVHRAEQICLSCWRDDAMTHGGHVYALAHLCAHGLLSAETTNRLACECRERLWDVSYPFDVLEALGILGGSSQCQLEHKIAIVRVLIDLVQRKPPEEIGSEVATEDGVVYVFGKETDFDTIVLPLVVRGLERICLAPNTTRSLRDNIIKCLLDVWGTITQYRIVWGPLAVAALTEAIGRIGGDEQTSLPYRVHIARVLSRHVERFTVVMSVGELFMRAGPSPELDALAVEAAEKMIEEWGVPDVTVDERLGFLLSLARTLARESLDPDGKQVRNLRRRAADLYFDALKDGLLAVREALTTMKECPTLPQRQRDEIEDRLGKTFGLLARQSGPQPR